MDFLAKIVARKLEESCGLFEAGVAQEFKTAIARRAAPLSLKAALDRRRPAIIAEIKRASPSRGDFAMGWDPVELAQVYQANGAAAISVLTEVHYFKGDPDFIRRMRPVVAVPILRKDFILEPIQVYESAALGADALLLIVSLLNLGQLRALLLLTQSLGLQALVEVHTRQEMETALAAGAGVIGINSRNLHTLEMFPDRALELAPLAPPEVTLVAASGLKTPADLERLERAGIHAFLIGETLVTAPDPGAKLREFVSIEGGQGVPIGETPVLPAPGPSPKNHNLGSDMVRIKICGITNLEDAQLAADLGADALGFIFYPASPRKVAPEAAREIIAQLPPLVMSVGVFVDEEARVVQDLAAQVGLDWVQLHGNESPDYSRSLGRRVIKGFRVQDQHSLSALAAYRGAAQALLLDTYQKGQIGGTGATFNWALAREARKYGPIILAGGLTPDNVARAIETALPQAVDVASGVESAPGKKDPEKLKRFFAAVRRR